VHRHAVAALLGHRDDRERDNDLFVAVLQRGDELLLVARIAPGQIFVQGFVVVLSKLVRARQRKLLPLSVWRTAGSAVRRFSSATQ